MENGLRNFVPAADRDEKSAERRIVRRLLENSFGPHKEAYNHRYDVGAGTPLLSAHVWRAAPDRQ
jgi:hypothetical protein